MFTHTGRGYTVSQYLNQCTEWEHLKCNIKFISNDHVDIIGVGFSRLGKQYYYNVFNTIYYNNTHYLIKSNYIYNKQEDKVERYVNSIIYKIVNYNFLFLDFELESYNSRHGLITGSIMFHRRFAHHI